MVALARPVQRRSGLLLPALLLIVLGTTIAAQTGILRLPAVAAAPETVVVPARAFSYRDSGDFQRQGLPIDAPRLEIARKVGLEITKYHINTVEYGACVQAGGCQAAEPRRKPVGLVPVTGVSFNDAEDYARWLSAETGTIWRLPTIAEWTFAAGSRAVDPALNVTSDGTNPADRWLANYQREAALGAGASATPEAPGSFGINEFGVADLGGSVWEWTATCDSRTTLDGTGAVLSHIESCGVRLLEGRHRTPMSTFIRDGRTGGCSVGAPPDNLGFRLVREPAWYAPLLDTLRRLLP